MVWRGSEAEIVAALVSLELDPMDYVVVGSGAMAIRGIRRADDIDLVVTPALFESLKARGWKPKSRPNGKPGLKHDNLEAYLDVNCGDFSPSTSWLLERSELHKGIPFLPLDIVRRFKLAYGRDKDLADIALIDAYLTGS